MTEEYTRKYTDAVYIKFLTEALNDIPPGTPEESVVLVRRGLKQLKAGEAVEDTDVLLMAERAIAIGKVMGEDWLANQGFDEKEVIL